MTCKNEGCENTNLATRSRLCKPCHNEYTRQHYQDNKQKYIDKARIRDMVLKALHRSMLRDYLLDHPCVDCGNADTEVLQFDHRDPEFKTKEVTRMLTGSTQKLWEEVAKCDIRCANCHIKKTRRQFGWWTND